MKKTTQIALACALSISALAPSLAQAELSYNVGIVSTIGTDDYRHADDPKNFKPALNFGVDYAFANGFYLSNANTTGKFADNNDMEMTLTAGFSKELANGLSYDVSASRYIYPSAEVDEPINSNDATVSLGVSGFSLAYTKPFTSSRFEGAHTWGLGYNWAFSDLLNVDFLVEKEQNVSGATSTVTVNYDFGDALTGYAEINEEKPKLVVGLSKSF